MSAFPVMMVWAPTMRALMDEAQTLLTVVQTTDSGSPAPRAHWRAGFWPRLGTQCQMGSRHRGDYTDGCLLGGEDIAHEDLLHKFRLDAGTLDSG
jgi:hypothetical protein